MRTASAYISKIKREVLGKTYKVQDTNHRLFTTTLYRGAAGCDPVDYTQLSYVEPCLCDYIGPAKKEPIIPEPIALRLELDGGTPALSGKAVIYGGNVRSSGINKIDGGIMVSYTNSFDGGSSIDGGNIEINLLDADGGNPDSLSTLSFDGGIVVS